MKRSLVKMYHKSEIPEGLTKEEAFKELTTFDYALPQDWLDNFVEKSGLNYDLVLSTTVWCYDNSLFGQPATCSIEVYEKLLESRDTPPCYPDHIKWSVIK